MNHSTSAPIFTVWGIIFYEMLTGRKPYEGTTAMSVIVKHAPASDTASCPNTSVKYQPAIDKMMAKRPGHRFQSVEELLEWRPATA